MSTHHKSTHDTQRNDRAVTDASGLGLDIPYGSLDAAALAELPYTFRPVGTATRFYSECFS
ncbi:hypothetical protein [Cupriavidus basilensis]|uniref:hypothetical protein n=1 Tax=Cupriavidus basilensis TaxID=68895 RepID=UPI0020A6C2FD|nr:hypothetical protein [Cupriavidus basilensis]MCP3019125.1 hypothetical protein [Cupriavidus basilensis]MDR3383823.1 hypothetical protein [Cupriavidus basilensis]